MSLFWRLAASQRRIKLPAELAVDAQLGMHVADGGAHFLCARLAVSMAGIPVSLCFRFRCCKRILDVVPSRAKGALDDDEPKCLAGDDGRVDARRICRVRR